MLGKLQPDFFPNVFGPNQDEPLDADVVRQKFEALAQEIADRYRRPSLARRGRGRAFKIAIENMANAIKKISVQRGYDVTRDIH